MDNLTPSTVCLGTQPLVCVKINYRNLIGPRSVPDFVEICIESAGRHFVQQRFPDVGAVTVDEEHVDGGIAPVLPSQLRRKRESAGASADNDGSA